MKTLYVLTAIFFLSAANYAQSRTISKEEYDKAFDFAVSETNRDFPLIFKVVTTFIENEKTARTVTELNENESQGHYRKTRTENKNGQETNRYQITFGFGNVFCSDDGKVWRSTQYECSGPAMFYGPRDPESVEYSVIDKNVDGKTFRVFREYSVFAPLKSGGKKEFCEKISTIDPRGFFITVFDTEGTLGPKTITLTREQSWVTKAKFAPVVAPK